MKNNNITNESISVSMSSNTNNVGTVPIWYDNSAIDPIVSNDNIVGKVHEENQYNKLSTISYNTIKINFMKNKDEILMKCKEYDDITYIIDQIANYQEDDDGESDTILDIIHAVDKNIKLAKKYPDVISILTNIIVTLKNDLIKEFRSLIHKLKSNSTSDTLNLLQESLYIQVDVEEFISPIANLIYRLEKNTEENEYDTEQYIHGIATSLSLLYRKTKFDLYLSYLDKKYNGVRKEILDKLNTVLSNITIDISINDK